jgi:Leucine-rich repeat (LRR) protein
MKVFYFTRVSLLLLLAFFPLLLQAAGWQVERADIGVQFSNMSERSVAIDSSGFTHIVYGKNVLYHSWSDASGDYTEVIDNSGSAGEYASIAIRHDATNGDTLFVSYYDRTHTTLKAAVGSAHHWSISTIDTTVYDHNSIVVDEAAGYAHIAYHFFNSGSNEIRHAYYDGSSWHHESVVSASPVVPLSIALDSSGNLHIVFVDNTDIKYIKNSSGAWSSVETVVGSANLLSYHIALTVDRNDKVYVAYQSDSYTLDLASKPDGGSWSTSTLVSISNGNTGYSVSMSSHGTNVYISYGEAEDAHDFRVQSLTYNGSSISYGPSTVKNFPLWNKVSFFTSLSVDPNDTVMVGYYSNLHTINIMDKVVAVPSDMGKYTSVATDTNGNLHVSYIDDVSYDLRYATNSSGTWSQQTIDTGVIQRNSIAVSSLGTVHICYYDTFNDTLKYAFGSGGSWSIETPDTTSDNVGEYCDITLDSDGHAHISYYDRTHGNLKYATKETGSWQYETVESTGNVGLYTSISLDGNNNATIAYADSSRHLFSISGTYGSWGSVDSPESGVVLKGYDALAIDSVDRLHTAYFKGTDFIYASRKDAVWSHETLDSSVNGDYMALDTDRRDNAYIAYYDVDDTAVKFATNASGAWIKESVVSSGAVGQYTSISYGGNKASICYYNADLKALECARKSFDRVDDAYSSIYYALDGEHWVNNSGWLGSSDKCTWYGITCKDGNVSLELNGSNLSGHLPPELQDIPNLQKIDFSHNAIEGNIPKWISNLTSLTKLSFHNNNLYGDIPDSIGDLVNLTFLSLYKNDLSGRIPTSIGNLTQLRELALSDNRLCGSIPVEIGSLVNLEELYLTHNRLSGTFPIALTQLHELRTLYLGYNELTGSIPDEIGNLTKLIQLFLYNNHFSGSIPSSLANITHLMDFTVSSNNLTGSIPIELGSISSFNILELDHNQLTGSIPIELMNLSNLRILALQDNNLTGEIPIGIERLTKLSRLRLSNNQLIGSIPSGIGSLTNLYWLMLYGNQLTGHIPESIGNLQNLSILSLSFNRLTGGIPDMSNMTSLSSLQLNNNMLSGVILSTITSVPLVDGYGLLLSNNCNLYTHDSSTISYIDTKASGLGGYSMIEQTNGHCLVISPIITYLLN